MERDDLWLAALRDRPGRTTEQFVASLRDTRELLADLAGSGFPLAWRLLRDRLLRETDPVAVRGWLHHAEAEGHVKHNVQEGKERWSITQSGQDYLRGRRIA